MSTNHYACTFSIDAALAGDDAAIRAQGARHVEEGRGLQTDSRGDWFLWTLGRMAADLHPQALRFLDAKNGVEFQDARGTSWRVSTVTPADVPAAAAAFAALVGKAQDDPGSLLPYFNDDWDLDEISEAIAGPQEYDDDDGMGPDYFFLNLEGYRFMFERVAAEGGGIAHFCCLP
jgi:hypothetical protein